MGVGENSLLERESELSLIEGLVERASGGSGGAVYIEAPAGVGKTELLRAAADFASAAGFRVLRGRGTELDRGFAFGVVRQLFERAVADQPALLEGGAEPAAAVFSQAGSQTGEIGFAPLHGLYWLTANLATENPLMIVADDLHWCDQASLRSLVFTATRLEEMPVILIGAARPSEPGAEQDLLDDLASAEQTTMMRPEPLSRGATSSLVRLRIPSAVDAFDGACHRATGGNPFLLGELLVELSEQGTEGSEDDAAAVLDFGSDRVGRAIRRRLRMLPGSVTSVARALAVIGPEPAMADLAALAGVTDEEAAHAVDSLTEIHVLQVSNKPDFIHPVVRSAIYDQIPLSERTALHADAARILEENGAETERMAQHVLRLPPAGDPSRIALLRRAGADASSRGALAAAAIYLKRALKEPPSKPERGEILQALGRIEAADQRPEDFEAHFSEALELTTDMEKLASIAIDFGWARGSSGDFRGGAEILNTVLERLPDDGVKLTEQLEALLLHSSFLSFTSPGSVSDLREHRMGELDSGKLPGPEIRAVLALWTCATRPPAADAIRVAEQVLEEFDLDDLNPLFVGGLAGTLLWSGELRAAARVFDHTRAVSVRRGDELTSNWQSVMQSDISLKLGEVRRSEAEARSGLSQYPVIELDGIAWTEAQMIKPLVARGAVDEAVRLIEEFPVGADPTPSFGVMLFLVARAHLMLATGSATAALRDATSAGSMAEMISNPYCCRWRSPAALALCNLDRREEALDLARSELSDARSFGIAAAEGAALRTVGMVLPGGEGLEELRASVEVLEGAEDRIEHVRSILELGAALRRDGERKEATSLLREAMDLASGFGASGLADRAHEELVAAGARPRRDRRMLSGPESLTASEDRVAALAAEGLTNREIAQRQFVTVKAVEWHLRNVFRKLDISSRDQLPEALS